MSYRTRPPATIEAAWKWYVGPPAGRPSRGLADSLDVLVELGIIPPPAVRSNLYGRRPGETLRAARARITAAWASLVGPVPKFYKRGRQVPPPLTLADDLATLLEIGAIEPTPAVALVESQGGRTIYHVLNRTDAVLPKNRPAYEDIVAAIAPRWGRSYQIFLRTVFHNSMNENSEVGYTVDPLTGEEKIRTGYYPTENERTLDGHTAGSWWRQLGRYRGPHMVREALISGQELTPGRLEAITLMLLTGQGYVIGWFIEINEPASPDANARWLRMKEGERNCVAEAVRRSYGGALTPRIASAIDRFEQSLDDGAAEEDIDSLTKALKVRIRILDLAGSDVYAERVDPATKKPYYSNSRKVITLYRHDGHVSLHDPGMPIVDRVEVFEGSTPGAPNETPEAAMARHMANAIAFIRERRPEQAQIIGGEIIAADGCVYRPKSVDRALHRAAADIGDRPRFLVDATDGDGERYKEDPTDGSPIPDILHVGGAASLRFKAWRAQNEWLSLWKPSREAWRSSQVEACVYRRDSGAPPNSVHIDMKAAYLACDSVHGSGPSRQWADRFGFARGGRMLTAVASVDELGHFAGFVEYAYGVEFSTSTPPGVMSQMANHLRKTADGQAPRVPIPLAVWLHERGYATAGQGQVVVHYGDRRPGIAFPEDRDSAVRFIGSCAYRSARRTMYTRDPAEAAHYASAYGSHTEPLDEGGHLISWECPEDESRRDFSHVRAYVLAYLAIAMGEAEAALGPRAVLERDTDAFILSSGCDVAEALGDQYEPEYAARWGVFRPKEARLAPAQRYAAPAPLALSHAGALLPGSPPRLDPESAHWLIAEIGPGGSGKTHKWLHRPPRSDSKVIILTFANEPAADLRTREKNPHGFPVETFHQWFRLGQNEPKTWTPAAMGTQAVRVTDMIFDEFPIAGPEFLAKALPWLRSKGVRVILTGDPLGQLQEFHDADSGQKVVDLLRDLGADMRESYGTDWRAKDCPRLQEAKRRAWCADTQTQYRELLRVATGMTYKEVLGAWKPSDIVLEATRRGGEAIAGDLALVRRSKYQTEPVRLKFDPVDRSKFSKKRGVLPMVPRPDGGGLIEAAIGVRVEAPPGTEVNSALWVVDDTSTVHSIQGRTIAAPRRIFICIDRMYADWCRNALYVAMSRAQRADQLVVFSGPEVRH